MPLSFPYPSNARASAASDETPDWATSDFPIFERAVNSGASGRNRAAPRGGGGEVIMAADRKSASPLDNLGQYAIDHYGVPPEKVDEAKRFGLGYALLHPKDAWTLSGMDKNKLGTVTREQDRALRKAFEDKGNRNGATMRENYNAAIASGKLRIVP
jgi:hypothetical protein